MPWWAWMVLGVVLLIAEIGVNTEFWLAVVGAAAFGLALMGLLGFDAPASVQWSVFAGLTVAIALFVRRPLHARRTRAAEELAAGLLGEEARALESIAEGATGQVSLRGSTWTARNEGTIPIASGELARIDGVEGTILRIRAG